jgi:hypothetical protein
MKTPLSEDFSDYGIYLGDSFSDLVAYLDAKTPIPESGNIYVAADPEMRKLPSAAKLAERFFPGAMQAGYCNGKNEKLNCLEYHGCPEIDIAADDLVLLFARQKDIVEAHLDSAKVVPFFLKKGQGVLLYPGTLHFSPCRQSEKGFRCAVLLSEGTNLPLEKPSSDPSYFKNDKWLLAHPEAKQASLGAYVGITGANISVPWRKKSSS